MTAAFIPVRGGSKSVPLKNIQPMNGRPLVYWVLDAACDCRHIDAVYVATDSLQIARCVEEYAGDSYASRRSDKIRVIGRSARNANDTASTESVMLEFAAGYDFDNIVLIQATSPYLQATDLDRGFALFLSGEADSVLSAVLQKRFIWEKTGGDARAVNYDVLHRPRRQEFGGYYVENGAFYITTRAALLATGCRLSGRIRITGMPEESYFEIDEPSDWTVAEQLLRKRDRQTATAGFGDVKIFLTDCDGCLTDGGMYYSEAGDELKKFNTRDAQGLAMLSQRGIITGIITGESTELVRRRAEKMGVDELCMGIRDKLSAARELCAKYGLSLGQAVYIGDDVGDTELLRAVGLGCCPRDAADAARAAADHVTRSPGGGGAVREVADWILSAMGGPPVIAEDSSS